jgi:regulation of enolase protein 1 (concanavalin A-like superfamily)
VSLPFSGKDYEQAGMFVYGSDSDWVKLTFMKIPGASDARVLEFTLQDNGNAIFDSGLDQVPVPAGFPNEAYLRIRNDGEFLTAAYSEDGETWTEFGRARPLSAIPEPHFVGLGAYNGDGSGNEAEFDFFDLEPIDVEPPECDEPASPDPGYEMLFDGTQASFDEWEQAGPGGFTLTDECTLESFGGLGMLYHPQLFESPATFRMEWMMPGDDNSGVFVGNWEPDPDYEPDPAWDAVDHGYEIQIDATDDADSTTGAIYNFQAPDAAARDAALNPPGEWNAYEITVDDPVIEVRLNGTLINQFTSTDPARDLSATKLGIQNHGAGDEVYFRRIQVATPDVGAAELDLEVKPKRRSVKPGRAGTFRATLRNIGDAPADGVRLCATAPKSKAVIMGRDCTAAGTLEPGDPLRDAVAVKAKRSAAGDRIRVRVTAESANAGRVSETVTLKVKKKKRKRGR